MVWSGLTENFVEIHACNMLYFFGHFWAANGGEHGGLVGVVSNNGDVSSYNKNIMSGPATLSSASGKLSLLWGACLTSSRYFMGRTAMGRGGSDAL